MTPSTAIRISASSQTIMGSLPPSSSVSCFSVGAASRATCLPVPPSPVNETFLIAGLRAISRPTVSPGPVTTFRTPDGRPAPARISASLPQVSGVVWAGFKTTVFPATRAGPIFQPMMIAGMFQGMIAPQIPSGRLSTRV